MLKWICAVLPITTLGCYDAVGTLEAFYQAIANHDCEKAVSLAEGYSIERCQAIANLQLLKPITVVKDEKNVSTLRYQVSYQTKQSLELISTEASINVKRVDKQWRVDFASLTTPAKPDTVKAVEEKKAVISETVTPVVIEPLAPVSQPLADISLLSLWQADDLQGKAGDEKIRYLKKADFSPPKRTTAKTLSALPSNYLNSIRRVNLPNNKKWLALTFDLCERADEVAGYDRHIINTLRDKNVKATFYVGGKWMQSHPDKTMQLMADRRFELGNHAWTHGNLRVLQGQAVQEQIVWTQAEYERLWDELQLKAVSAGLNEFMQQVPQHLQTLRFPFGTCSPESLKATNDFGLSAIQWDVVSGDPAITVQAQTMIHAARSGSIMIFHANGRGKGTAAALPSIIDGLRAKGFEFVTVSELLAAGQPEAVNECYELVKGDNLIYDAKYGDGMARIKKPKIKPKPIMPEPLLLEPQPSE